MRSLPSILVQKRDSTANSSKCIICKTLCSFFSVYTLHTFYFARLTRTNWTNLNAYLLKWSKYEFFRFPESFQEKFLYLTHFSGNRLHHTPHTYSKFRLLSQVLDTRLYYNNKKYTYNWQNWPVQQLGAVNGRHFSSHLLTKLELLL